MIVKIYQINNERDIENRHFMSSKGRKVDPYIYDEVFNADIEESDVESIYTRFTTIFHPIYRGASMSVSDVIVFCGQAYFCESIGFTKIEFDESKTQKIKNLTD